MFYGITAKTPFYNFIFKNHVIKDCGSVAEIPVLCLFVSEEAAESMRYWEQFRQAQPQENTAEEQQKSKKRNMRLVGYCMLAMLLSISGHYFGFR